MHLGGKCKVSWSNDDLERFLKVRAICAPPHESIRSQGAMTDRVKPRASKYIPQRHKETKTMNIEKGRESKILSFRNVYNLQFVIDYCRYLYLFNYLPLHH